MMQFTFLDALLYPLRFFSGGFERSGVLLAAGIPLLLGVLAGWKLKQNVTAILLPVLAVLYIGVTLPFYFNRILHNDMLSIFCGPVLLCLFAGVILGKILRKLTSA